MKRLTLAAFTTALVASVGAASAIAAPANNMLTTSGPPPAFQMAQPEKEIKMMDKSEMQTFQPQPVMKSETKSTPSRLTTSGPPYAWRIHNDSMNVQ